jgi:hypothetical protein
MAFAVVGSSSISKHAHGQAGPSLLLQPPMTLLRTDRGTVNGIINHKGNELKRLISS